MRSSIFLRKQYGENMEDTFSFDIGGLMSEEEAAKLFESNETPETPETPEEPQEEQKENNQ